MSITETTTRISHQWLERKSKAELAAIIMANLDQIDLFASGRESQAENRIFAMSIANVVLEASGLPPAMRQAVNDRCDAAVIQWLLRRGAIQKNCPYCGGN